MQFCFRNAHVRKTGTMRIILKFNTPPGHYAIYKVYIARRFKEILEKKEKKRKEEEKASRHPQYLKTHALLLELRLFSSRQIFTRKKKKKKKSIPSLESIRI